MTTTAHEGGTAAAPAETMTLATFPDVGRVDEVAAVLRCSKWCDYDLIDTGDLKAIRLGRAIRVTRRAFEEFLSV
jgi:excisionase family DNA binding protein